MKEWESVATQLCQQLEEPLARLAVRRPPTWPGLIRQVGALRLDFSRTHLSPDLWAAIAPLWPAGGWRQAFADMVSGAIVNASEKRAALHTAARGYDMPEHDATGAAVAAPIAEADRLMQATVERLRAPDSGYDAIVHLGMGGSYLGPALVLEALAPTCARRFETRLAANIDPQAFRRAVAGLDPARTLVVAVSKSWTTLETQANLQLAHDWLRAGGIADPGARTLAVTARTDLAAADGVDASRVLPFGEWVGGRYSLWSPVGVTIALTFGWDVFMALRAGGRIMDSHVAGDDMNAATLAAVSGYACSAAGAGSRAVFAYDERLRLLVPYLQQLELESLGKRVTAEGLPYTGAPAPVIWGGVGTDGQHAVFQWLHQSSDWAPVDLIACAKPVGAGQEARHRTLLANALAQASVLMHGRAAPDDPVRAYPGNRPSTMILLETLTPESLGTLLAFYEHRTYALALLMGVNAFDQMGVELGKTLATGMDRALATGDTSGLDAEAAALVGWLRTR